MNDPQFMQELEQFKQQIDLEAMAYVKEAVTMMLDMITDGNPLDTGRATSAWVASTGSPVYRQSEDVTTKDRLSRSAAKEISMATLEPGLAAYQLGDIIYLANGEMYISMLEENLPALGGRSGYVKTKDGHPFFVRLTKSAFDPFVDSTIHIP